MRSNRWMFDKESVFSHLDSGAFPSQHGRLYSIYRPTDSRRKVWMREKAEEKMQRVKP